MQPITQEWVDKAEGDWAVTGRELRARRSPNYDAACFHAQQCAEKYLKGRLQEDSLAFPKTHNLPVLLTLALPVEPSGNVLRAALPKLDDDNVEFRYPGRNAVAADAQDAQQFCRTVRDAARRRRRHSPSEMDCRHSQA